MKVLLHGSGAEAQAAARYFKKKGQTELSVFDDHQSELAGAQSVSMPQAMSIAQSGMFLRSPGVPPTHPLVTHAAEHAKLATTPTGLWFRDEAPPGTISVTGTKGKSTTSALLALILEEAGLTSSAYGNIGRPPLDQELPIEEHPVVELSSYMMHDLPEADHLHVITSLFSDHLDWHGSIAAYHEAKLRPFRRAVPAEGVAPQSLIESHGLPSSVRAIEGLTSTSGERMYVAEYPIEIGPVDRGFGAGPLRKALLAAAAVAHTLLPAGRAAHAVSAAANRFSGLPSRQEIVPSADGRVWVDDSLATIPEATIDVLKRFRDRDVVVLLGGADRGIEYTELVRYLEETPSVTAVGFGPVAERLTGLAVRAEGLPEAIDEAEKRCTPGGVILFSPAAPSSPPFQSFKERSAVFHQRATSAR